MRPAYLTAMCNQETDVHATALLTSQLTKETTMLGTILLIILILMLLGALPSWRHSAQWGYGPSGGLGLIVIILIILVLLGRI